MNSSKQINIAIDGYSSCGKSTLAKALAKTIGYTYIDSGAMYRAITLYFIENKINYSDLKQINNSLNKINIVLQNQNDHLKVLLNNEDVSDKIRTLDVANKVSDVAAIKEVRLYAVHLQKEMGKHGGVVMDGRDIGTVVFPNAELKIFMNASEEVRIERRYEELIIKQPNITKEEVKQNIQQRDLIDTTRVVDPLTKADDAILLDNSNMTKEEQLQWALNLYKDIVNKL